MAINNKLAEDQMRLEELQRQQMNDPTQGVTIDNLQMLDQIDEMNRISDMRDQQNAHNPDHATYGVGKGMPQSIITDKDVRNADEILLKYKQGKANLERKIIDNEQWWKLRHWEQMRVPMNEKQKEDNIRATKESTSAWLFNSLVNKHADIMDNYPEASVLPRARDDEETAKVLSSIIPVVLEQNDFEQVYNDEAWYKLKTGTGVYKVIWNSSKNNGMGDIAVLQVDLLNLFWQPGIKDIQDSENFFHVSIESNKKLKKAYPDLKLKDGSSPSIQVDKYLYDDQVDTSDMSAVVDWFYKIDIPVENMPGVKATRTVVHYVKYCNGQLLYASENDPQYSETGYFEHGKYPYVFDVLFPEEGTPCGFGFIDIMKSPQEYIDKLGDKILQNASVNSKARWIVSDQLGINEQEFADVEQEIIHCTGPIDDRYAKPVPYNTLPSIYLEVLNSKINELKETSGNRDVNQGSTQSGVTAASAISALMEAGSKGSRDMNKSAFRAFTEVCNLIIELMRQFYDQPRVFRITGNSNKGYEYQSFDNSGLVPQDQGTEFGIDLGSRLPVFDVSVEPAKKSAYSKMSENELAIQFYNLGFFAPNNADQSLACLEMMDFAGKEAIVDKISQNQTMFETIQQLQAMIMQLTQAMDAQNGTNMTAQMMGMAGANDAQINNVQANPKAADIDGSERGSQAQKAANNAQNVASPR